MNLKHGLNGHDMNWDYLDRCNYDEKGLIQKYSDRGWSVYYSNDGFVRVIGHVPYEAYSTEYLYELLESDETNKYQKSRIRKELRRRGEI